MKLLIPVILLVIVLLLTTNREPFTELFGFSGYTQPVSRIRFDDTKPILSDFTQAEADIDNDMMQNFVLQTNKEISKRTGLCTYIIETTGLKKFVKEDKTIYECKFMTVKNNGFSFGFSVVAYFEDGKIISLRTQPLDVESASDIAPFVDSVSGKEFVNYDLVKENAIPTLSELEMAKNKLQ
tara:strand:- start:941 stop:1486 length:546 start_codon:yes stop_codon:yes gene_type:complete